MSVIESVIMKTLAWEGTDRTRDVGDPDSNHVSFHILAWSQAYAPCGLARLVSWPDCFQPKVPRCSTFDHSDLAVLLLRSEVVPWYAGLPPLQQSPSVTLKVTFCFYLELVHAFAYL